MYKRISLIITRKIDDSELFQLIELNYKYNKCLPHNQNKFASTSILINSLIQDDALALGVFRDKELIGFTLGYKFRPAVFHFTALYIEPKYKLYTKRLYEASEQAVRLMGYNSWVCEGVNRLGAKLHERMGAKLISITENEITYFKDI